MTGNTGRVEAVVIRLNGGPAYLTDPRFVGFKEVPIETFLRDPKLALAVDDSQSVAWSLRTADRVVVEAATGKIISVNGMTDPAKSASRPRYSDLVNTPGSRPQYPPREWPLLDHTELVVRAMQLLAPIGPGSQAFYTGPFDTGKTRASRATTEALLKIAFKQGNMAFVVLQVGERRVDVQPMETILGQYTGQFPIYHYVSVLGETGPYATVNLCQMALEKVKRLYEMGYHVVYVVDSLAGLATEAFIPTTPSGSPLGKGGVSEYALTQIKQHVAVAGYGGAERSVTGIYTALEGEIGSRAGNIFGEVGGPQSSTVWRFGNFAMIDYPKIDLRSHSREVERMLVGERLELHRRLQKIVVSGGAAYDDRTPARRLEILLKYAKVLGTFDEALVVWRTWWRDEKKPAGTPEDTVSSSVAFLTSKAVEVLGRITNPAKASAAVLEMIRTGRSLADSVAAVEWLVKALSAEEREMLFALLTKAELMPLAPSIPAGDPLENFIAAADALRNGGGDLHAAVKQALARMGLTPEQLVEVDAPIDGAPSPAKLMEAVLDTITERTSRTFKKKGRWAKELLDKGFTPPADLDHLEDCEVFDRLTAKDGRGWKETMENLLSSGPRKR